MNAALRLDRLTAGYAGVPAVREFDLELASGEMVALLGPNGAGKTTTLLAAVGVMKPMGGTISSFGADLTGKPAEKVARTGIAMVPDDGGVFHSLTVAEHLRLARTADGDAAREEALQRFPQLRPLMGRRCGLLSGGEQRMLALAKALVTRPKVILIDELSLGLAPMIVRRLLAAIRDLTDENGTSVILVEQHVDLALQVADRAIVLNRGRVALAGGATQLREDADAVRAAYFEAE